MIIQCEKCLTKFRLDDSKVADRGVKVRCTKCKHVFTVGKEQPEPEAIESAPAPEQFTAAASQAEVPATAPALQEAESRPPSVSAFEIDIVPPAGSTYSPVDSTVNVPPGSAPASPEEDEFPFSGAEDDLVSMREPDGVSPAAGVIDFDSFDFGGSIPEEAGAAPPAAGDFSEASAGRRPDVAHGLDFSGDDMFGSVVPPKAEESGDVISFDIGTDSFAESIETGSTDAGEKDSGLSLGTTGGAPFSLGDIDFGDELTSVAVQQVNPEELKPSQEILFAPLAEAQEKPVDRDDLTKAFPGDTAGSQHELPPLLIASRRKQSPLFGGLIAVAALLVIGILGYFGFTAFSTEKGRSLEESGTISVHAVTAAFVDNDEIGTLLVISGEARNGYPKPRAALQVKGLVYDAAGRVLAGKEAYCGNPLTDEQLASLPLDKIEAAMANQFGDSLGNMEVAPGTAVPFTIIIPAPPKGARNFGVEVVGSTVASGKQQ